MPSLEVDVIKLQQLIDVYEASRKQILSNLPKLNWNSYQQVKNHFLHHHWLSLQNNKITTLQTIRNFLDHDSEVFDELTGYIEYRKTTATLNNYLYFLLKNGKNGPIPLQEIDGELYLPNKRPAPKAEIITECLRHREE